jgi:hypothetical protein
LGFIKLVKPFEINGNWIFEVLFQSPNSKKCSIFPDSVFNGEYSGKTISSVADTKPAIYLSATLWLADSLNLVCCGDRVRFYIASIPHLRQRL